MSRSSASLIEWEYVLESGLPNGSIGGGGGGGGANGGPLALFGDDEASLLLPK
jgi:hypothetical protein